MSFHIFARFLEKTPSGRDGLTECHPDSSDPWLGRINQEIAANEPVNNQIVAGVLGAPPRFGFVCGRQWHTNFKTAGKLEVNSY